MGEDFFVWDDCSITSTQDIVNYEKRYMDINHDRTTFDEDLPFNEAELILLSKGRFDMYNHPNKIPNCLFISKGLSELEALVLAVFHADISGLFRTDAYHWGIPPVVKSLCEILDSGLKKLPQYNTGQELVRKLHEYDKIQFNIGETFTPGYSLTASANSKWRVGNYCKYFITPKKEGSNAHVIYDVYAHGDEMQVTFTKDASFVIDNIKDNYGIIEIFMHEQ